MTNKYQFPDGDDQFEDSIITSVHGDSTHGWTITKTDGWCFGVPSHSTVVPAVGMAVRMYGKGVGYPVRGLFLEGVECFYRTEDQHREYQEAQIAEQRKAREIEYESRREEYEARVAALPEVFRQRFERFRAGSEKFRANHESYELFTCEQAVAIASALQTADAIEDFRQKSWDEQKALVPEISDQHSGNTFGCACALATAYVVSPSFVAKMHGALTPLVGCEDYGCTHTTEAQPA